MATVGVKGLIDSVVHTVSAVVYVQSEKRWTGRWSVWNSADIHRLCVFQRDDARLQGGRYL